jgi:hypothetical protein
MEPEGSLLHSQVPTTCPYPEPATSQSHAPFSLLRSYQNISPGPRQVFVIRNKASFYGEELAPRPTPNMEGHPLPAVRECFFNIFAATLYIGGRSSNRNPRTRQAVVTGTPLSLHQTLNLKIVCFSQPPQDDVIYI